MRSRLRKARQWLAEEARWHRSAVDVWRELRRRPVEVGTLSNDQIDSARWNREDTTAGDW